MTTIPLGDGGEFDRIRRIAEALGEHAGPLGDDTAPIPGGVGTLVVSTDTSVDGVHFRRDWLTLPEIGRRAAASALSDLAAAAAAPAGLTVALTAGDLDEDGLVAVMRGVGEAAGAAGCRVLGGDLSSGATLGLAVTVFGHAERLMSRVGAKAGDDLWVTGTLGGARAALIAWERGDAPDAGARRAFADPSPRHAVARWLAAAGATAMMDVSDGLGGDAPHLAAASGVGVRIELERLPIGPGVPEAARALGEDPAVFAATGGEDYELLVAMPRGWTGAAACLAETGVPATRIGTVRRDPGVVATLMGAIVPVHGYRHRLPGG